MASHQPQPPPHIRLPAEATTATTTTLRRRRRRREAREADAIPPDPLTPEEEEERAVIMEMPIRGGFRKRGIFFPVLPGIRTKKFRNTFSHVRRCQVLLIGEKGKKVSNPGDYLYLFISFFFILRTLVAREDIFLLI